MRQTGLMGIIGLFLLIGCRAVIPTNTVVAPTLPASLPTPTEEVMAAVTRVPTTADTAAPTPLPLPDAVRPALNIPEGALARLGTGDFGSIQVHRKENVWAVMMANTYYYFDLDTFEQLPDQGLKEEPESMELIWQVPGIVSPDGRYKVTVDAFSRVISLIDASTGANLYKFHAESFNGGWIERFEFSPDSRYLVGFSGISGTDDAPRGDNRAYVWDLTAGEELAVLEHQGVVGVVDWSPDGKFIATGTGVYSDSSEVVIWDARTGEAIQRWDGLEEHVTALKWSADGTYLAAGLYQTDESFGDMRWFGRLIVWDMRSRQEVFQHPTPTNRITWIGEDRILSASPHQALLWDAASGIPLKQVEAFPPISGLTWSPDGNQIVIEFFQEDQTPVIWNLSSGEYERLPADIPSDWTLETRRERFPDAALISQRYFVSPDHSAEVHIQEVGIYHFQITVIDRETGIELTGYEVKGLGIYSAAFSPDGTWVAFGLGAPRCAGCSITTTDHNYILLINLETGEYHRLEGHIDWVTNLLWFSDGTMLASISQDGTAIIWDIQQDWVVTWMNKLSPKSAAAATGSTCWESG